jgi:hypothetical protein
MTAKMVIVFLSAWALKASAQPAMVTGRVLTADGADAVVNARVRVVVAGRPSLLLITDSSGRVTFPMQSGAATVVATKSGFTRREVSLAAGATSIDVLLERAAVVAGRVLAPGGDPVVGVPVFVRAVTDRRPASGGGTTTDDSGEYRIPGLVAGRYVAAIVTTSAAAAAQNDRGGMSYRITNQQVYYPSTLDRDSAEPIVLAPGEERENVDFAVSADQNGGPAFGMVAPLLKPEATTGRATIRGRVASTDGRLLAYARVLLGTSTDPVPRRSAMTDGSGRFELTDVPAGRFRISAMKPGYAGTTDSSLAPFLPGLGMGPTIEVADGDVREGIEIALRRLGTLTGSVSDELGDPIVGATVQLLHVEYASGRRRLVPAGLARQTDDRGRYRVYNVQPGQYVVTASVGGAGSADLPGYARSYFPGSADAGGAQFISVAVSQDLTGIDFSLTPVHTARIAGHIVDAGGAPNASGTVQLRPVGGSIASIPLGARIGDEGAFEFTAVAPGQYVIVADRGRAHASAEGEFAAVPVAVDGVDVTDLAVQTTVGSTIAGRVTFDTRDPSKQPAPNRMEIWPIPIDFDAAPTSFAIGSVEQDWTFRITGVHGPRRLEAMRVPAGWAVRDIRVNGVDVTDRPLPFGSANQSLSDVEVVLTDRFNVLKGTVLDDAGAPSPATHVIVFATDRTRWYPGSRFVRMASTAADGTFSIEALPDDAYDVAVTARLPADGEDGWQDPAFLDSLRSIASTVTLSGNATRTITSILPAK